MKVYPSAYFKRKPHSARHTRLVKNQVRITQYPEVIVAHEQLQDLADVITQNVANRILNANYIQ